LLYTAGGGDITILSNGGMVTGNGKLKGLGEKPAALPVVTSITRHQHTSNCDLSIPCECAKM